MASYQNNLILFHRDVELFREAILFTARRSGFAPALVEKDYYCTVLLNYLYQQPKTSIVFRGGTCLSKVYAEFNRLSEDIDFTLPTSPQASRAERKKRFQAIKEHIIDLPKAFPEFRLPEGVKGYSNNTQYTAEVFYESIADIGEEASKVRIEVGLRENLLCSPVRIKARTLLIDPFMGKPAVSDIYVVALEKEEAYAEKIRAALSRQDVEIRDFFDIEYATKKLRLNLNDNRFLKLVIEKLKVPGNYPIDISSSRKDELKSQTHTRLKPVLRQTDFEQFDLERAFNIVAEIGRKLSTVSAWGAYS